MVVEASISYWDSLNYPSGWFPTPKRPRGAAEHIINWGSQPREDRGEGATHSPGVSILTSDGLLPASSENWNWNWDNRLVGNITNKGRPPEKKWVNCLLKGGGERSNAVPFLAQIYQVLKSPRNWHLLLPFFLRRPPLSMLFKLGFAKWKELSYVVAVSFQITTTPIHNQHYTTSSQTLFSGMLQLKPTPRLAPIWSKSDSRKFGHCPP